MPSNNSGECAMRTICVFALGVLWASVAIADDWPQWLGPRRDGSTTEKVVAWKGDLKVLWRKSVGEGHSSPVVADGRVYLHTRVAGKDAEVVECYQADDG